ncbi:MAG: hypothetical protein ACNA71_09285 [Kiritimatiellia bacterium]
MDGMTLPPSDDAAWSLAAAGSHRYAGGWIPLGATVAPGTAFTRPFLPVSLRLGVGVLGQLLQIDSAWRPGSDEISPSERLLLWWALRVPQHSEGPIRGTLTETMLLTPAQMRIELEPVDVSDDDS